MQYCPICNNNLQQSAISVNLELNAETIFFHYIFSIIDILVLQCLYIGSKYCIVGFVILGIA